MALSTKVKTSVDLQVSPAAQRVCALSFATDIAVASIKVGNGFPESEVTTLAEKMLDWLQREEDEEETG